MSRAPDTPQKSAPEHCPTCGCRVRVVSGDEGTSFFRPVLTESEINEALEDPVIKERLARVEEILRSRDQGESK